MKEEIEFDSITIICLENRDLFQTLSDELITGEEQVSDIHEIRQLLGGKYTTY